MHNPSKALSNVGWLVLRSISQIGSSSMHMSSRLYDFRLVQPPYHLPPLVRLPLWKIRVAHAKYLVLSVFVAGRTKGCNANNRISVSVSSLKRVVKLGSKPSGDVKLMRIRIRLRAYLNLCAQWLMPFGKSSSTVELEFGVWVGLVFPIKMVWNWSVNWDKLLQDLRLSKFLNRPLSSLEQ